MKYKCEVCQDTGSISKHLSGQLDCVSCDAATERVDMGKFLDKLSAVNDYDAAWLVHQRALAMAPKQEALGQKPAAWLVYAEDHNGMVPQHPASAAKLEATRYAAMFGQTLTEVRPLYDHVAPAAANGALTDEQIQQAANEAVKRRELSWSDYRKDSDGKYTIPNLAPYHFQFARAILAAADPDAALVKALERIARWHGEFPDVLNGDGTTSSYAVAYGSNGERDYMRQVALDALSGAKGN